MKESIAVALSCAEESGYRIRRFDRNDGGTMELLERVEKRYPEIDQASSDFMDCLPGESLPNALAIAAQMAGLTLLRNTSVDLETFPPGSAIIGAVEEDAFLRLTSFILNFAASNDLDPNSMDMDAIPTEDKAYIRELTQFEKPFYDACERNEIEKELYPFVAAAAAGKLVMAGDQMNLLSPKIGLAMVLYHFAAGGKTVPFPAT